MEKCMHCKGEGTCLSGKDGLSCHECSRKSRVWFLSFYAGELTGAKCNQCSGTGKLDAYTDALNERIRPALAAVILPMLIIIPVTMHSSENFSAILAFCSSLAGAMVSYFFSSNKDSNKN